jgi:hypothetical protein
MVTPLPGSWVFKPRAQWHTFWNSGHVPYVINLHKRNARSDSLFVDGKTRFRGNLGAVPDMPPPHTDRMESAASI